METKNAITSWTLQGLLAMIPAAVVLPFLHWGTLAPEEKAASVAAAVGWLWALIGRLRQGDLHVTTPRIVGAFLLCAVVPLVALAGCATSSQPVSAPQAERVAQGERGNSLVLGDGWSSTSPKALAELPNDTLLKYGHAKIVARAPDGQALLDKSGAPIFDEYQGVRSVVQNFGSISQTSGEGTAGTSGAQAASEIGKQAATQTPTTTVSPNVNIPAAGGAVVPK